MSAAKVIQVVNHDRSGFVSAEVLARFAASIGARRLRFLVCKVAALSGGPDDVTVTEVESLARFPEFMADRKIRGVTRVEEARGVIRRAVKAHGAKHVLSVIDRTTRDTKTMRGGR